MPKPSCTGGGAVLAFDGGVVDLSTHEVWALCASKFCRHKNCHGQLAAEDSTGEYPPAVFRVRNQRDLKKHLSPDGRIGDDALGEAGTSGDLALSTRIVVFPKGMFKGRPTVEHVLDPSWLPTVTDPAVVVATGSISVRQSRRLTSFPITAHVAERLTALVADRHVSPRMEGDGVTEASRSRARNFLERLASRYGIYHVEQAFTRVASAGPDGRATPVGLASDLTDMALVEHEGLGRLSRATSPRPAERADRAASAVKAVPSEELSALAPYPGKAVADSMHVEALGSYTPHGAFRFFDRVYGELSEADLHAALAGRPVAAGTRALVAGFKRDLPSLLTDLLHEAVFATSAEKPPLPDYLRSSVSGMGGRPQKHANTVAVTVPHPLSKDHFLELIGEVGSFSRHPLTGRKSFAFKLVTVTPVARNGAMLADVADARPDEQTDRGRKPVPPHRRGGSRTRGGSYSSVGMLAAGVSSTPSGVADRLSKEEEERVSRALGFH